MVRPNVLNGANLAGAPETARAGRLVRGLFAPLDRPLSTPSGIAGGDVGYSRLMGDGLLAEFPSVVERAVDIQPSVHGWL
jgi:hypothetical protein